MIFLLASAVLLLIGAVSMLRLWLTALGPARADSVHHRTGRPVWYIMTGLILATLVNAPVLSSIFDAAQFGKGQSVAMTSGTWVVVVSLVAALGIVVLEFAVTYIRRRTEASPAATFLPAFFKMAMALLCIVATGSHLDFFLKSKDGWEGGFAETEFLRDGDPTVKCRSPIAAIRWNGRDDTPVTYRCPKDIVLMQLSSTPFVPWPSYEQGESLLLAKKLSAVIAGAPKVH